MHPALGLRSVLLATLAIVSLAWAAFSAATVPALGGSIARIAFGAPGVARFRVGRTEVSVGLLPIAASVAARSARPGAVAPEEAPGEVPLEEARARRRPPASR